MKPARYRKKPIEIEAMELTEDNLDEVAKWTGEYTPLKSDEYEGRLFITTLEGTMEAKVGDYIVKGVKGEFYPVKPDIFNETYSKVL